MKKAIYSLMMFLLFAPFLAFAQQTENTKVSLQGDEIYKISDKLRENFSQCDVFQFDFSELRRVAKTSDQFEVSLKMGNKHQWNLLLLLNDMRAPDYVEMIPTVNGMMKLPSRRPITYTGYINNPGSLGEEVRLNISEHFLNGYVTVEGQEYFIEEATITDPRAPKDYYVIYRPQDVMSSGENTCTFDQAQNGNSYEEGEVKFDLEQHKMASNCFEVDFVTACTWDFVQTQSNDPVMANDRIAAITNLVEGLFSPFMLDYNIISQFAPGDAASDPFTASDSAFPILSSFNPWAGANFPPHDLGQIWVGRNIQGCGGSGNFGLIGCAQCIGCICETNRYNVCENFWSQNTNCLRTLSAHECGHNWDGVHSQSTTGTIMRPFIGCSNTTWAPGNVTRIQNHINSRTCLDACCELVVDCSNIRDQRLTCYEDLPPANINLPIIVSSCGPVTVTYYDLTTIPPGPGSVLRVYTITDSEGNTTTCSQKFQINGIGWVKLTKIDNVKNPCLEAEVCFSGEYRLCNGINEIPPTELVFKENGLTVATFPITLNANGTFKECISKKKLLEAGLETGTGYDVCVRLNTSWGTTLVSPAFVFGQNNDFKFGAYAAEIISVPECVKKGVPFTITVEVDGWINYSEIDAIYSSNNLYTYVSHTIAWTPGQTTIMNITFISNTCTCEGEMLTFDIVIEGCSCPIWLMTDKIPCCSEPCEKTYVKDWKVGDCYFYDGCLARDFVLYVSSPNAITGITAVGDNITCTTTILNLNITGPVGGIYTVTGTMKFDDNTCTGHAQIDMFFDTKEGCCSLTQNFSFPGGCKIPEPCTVKAPRPQLIYDGNPPVMTISINFPLGTPVSITNNNTNATTNTTIGKITCGPFFIDQNGTVGGGTSCTGIKIEIPSEHDCRKPVEGQNTMYSYTIKVGECIWVITGDYCRVTTIYKLTPVGTDGKVVESSDDRNAPETESIETSLEANNISVYPNPIRSSEVLNFDFTATATTVKTIHITDMSGKLIERIIPQEGSPVFSHTLSSDLVQGVYFVVFGLEDGSVQSKKLISIE